MGKAIRRVQAASAVLMLATLGFFGAQPAVATETSPGPGTEQPGETPNPDPNPIDPLPVDPIPGNPVPVDPPVVPTDPNPAPVEPNPAPVPPPVVEPVTPVAPPAITPPAVAPVAPPVIPSPASEQVITVPLPEESFGLLEQALPIDPATPTTQDPTPTPTPTPIATKTAAPPVVSADIAGPLKVALAPVAENNPLVQGVTVLVLLLLGAAYFRALRSKGVRRPRLSGK